MIKKTLATAIAATSLFSLSLFAYESADDYDAAGANLQIALMETLQVSEEHGGYAHLANAVDRESPVAPEPASENLCNAKTFCPLD